MCLTIPARVVSVSGREAEVLESGKERSIDISLLPRLKAGDWILHTTGLAIKKVSPKDAKDILWLLEAAGKIDDNSLSERFRDMAQAARTRGLTKEEISYLLETDNPEEVDALHSEANTIRKAYLKEFICVHGIIEFSNHCTKDCRYCGIMSGNSVKRYRMTIQEVVAVALKSSEKGYKLLVLQSGEDPYYTDDILEEMIRTIKQHARVFIFLSIGERGYDSYRRLREAGASGILLRFETSNPDLFRRLHPEGKDLDNRLSHIRFLKEMGYFIATGFMVGLPGQTIDDIATDILTLQRLSPGMVSIGPFIPSPGTSFPGDAAGSTDITLRTMSILRLLMRSVRIPVTTALETIGGVKMRKAGLMAGGNALMFNLTPPEYRLLYQIYPDRFYQRDRKWERYALFQGRESFKMLESEILALLKEVTA